MMQTVELRPGYVISRVIKGGWHLAGGHGEVAHAHAMADMAAYVAAGITTFDCADIYTGVESLIGDWLRDAPAADRTRVRVHTKFVPDLDILPRIDRAQVARIIDRSRTRLGRERLDLVQFHWWDYDIPRWLDTALWLRELQREGAIELLGGTNFDTAHVAALLAAGIDLATMQVQFSLLDDRPLRGLATLGPKLLCYGTVAGGFLSDRWLGQPEPAGPLANRSLTKYKLIIDDAGGWDWFQALLRTLAAVGRRHGADIAAVASRCVLEFPAVAAVIIGVARGAHLASHAALCDLRLDATDHAAIDAVLAQRRPLEGDVYALERDRTGRHGRIMHYNLGN